MFNPTQIVCIIYILILFIVSHDSLSIFTIRYRFFDEIIINYLSTSAITYLENQELIMLSNKIT